MANPHSLTPRESYLRQHRQWLASWAVSEAECGGRRFDEPEHPYRTCFQRDRDRIVHCSAFRRLDFKTQVFVPHEHDHFRTRLTHTLEVAQIGRTIGRALRLNEDIIEAVALAHDLGHPPFGHGGEAVLEELMADFGHFEHNRQSLRIVDYLEHPYPQFRGLNLTNVVRECLAKHETRYDTPICEEFNDGLLAPLAGQIIDLADEIAYTTADLDDALSAGWITVDQLMDIELWQLGWSAAEAEASDAGLAHKRIRACKGVLATMADDVVATTTETIRNLTPNCSDDIRRTDGKCAVFSPQIADAVQQMQDFLMQEVYLNTLNAKEDSLARHVIQELFQAYVSDAHLLPDGYYRRIDNDGLRRVVCDYISGMTDRFCKAEHARICR